MTRCPLCNVPGAALAPAVMNVGGVAALHLVTEQVCADGEACAQRMNAQRSGQKVSLFKLADAPVEP